MKPPHFRKWLEEIADWVVGPVLVAIVLFGIGVIAGAIAL